MPNTSPSPPSPPTLPACAKHLRRSEEEIKEALVKLGAVKRVTKGMLLNDDMMRQLTDHFRNLDKTSAADAGARPTSRKVNSTEVVERKVRGRGTGAPAAGGLMEKLRAKKAAEAAAKAAATGKPATPAKETTPAEKPAPKKVVTAPKPADAAKSAAAKKAEAEEKKPAAKKAAPAAKPAKEDAKKTAAAAPAKKKTAAAKSAETAKSTASAKKAKAETPAPVAEAPPASEPAAAPEPAPAPVAEEAAGVAPAAAEAEARKSHYLEELLSKQQQRDAQMSEAERRLQDAKQKKAAAPAPAAPAAAAAPKRDKGDTIKLDKAAIAKHKKKRKQNISRSAAREITAESQHTFKKPTAPVVREIKIPEAISITKLANETALKSSVIIRKLMDHGMSVTANEVLDKETAWILVEELGHRPVEAPDDDMEKELLKRDATGTDIQPRAPVVTVMGHVDHGKTSLLDHIRKTRVAPGEAGGITQHIGAYRVESKIGAVTFLDTPGHALFSQMRARGARVTDIVLLVVAADDGVKPQTVEAINHAKAANVPIIVAANKIDKPEADLARVKRELAQHEVLPEDWGGDAMVVPVSASTGEGVDKLLDALAMQSELLELRAPLDVPAVGVVIEARVDKGRGIVATLVMTRGVLKRGNAFLCGTESGRVRMMWNLSHPKLESAAPSVPVEMQGLSGIPEAGAELLVVEDERTAREVAALRQDKLRLSKMTSRRLPAAGSANINDQAAALLDAATEEREYQELHVIVKADVEGSREAMVAALSEISGKNAGVKIIHSAVGTVTESDIYLAQAGGGVIMSFNVRPDSRARKLAESRGVKIISGNVVYELVEKAREAVLGLLAPIVEETVMGTATVLRVFNISKVGNIAGCRVEEGAIRSKSPLRLLRDGVVVHEGVMSSLHHFKDEASEIRAGSECGIGISKYNDIKAGDVIEALERTESAPEL